MRDTADTYVIGGNHHNTLGVVRSLGERGVSPVVICVTTEADPYVLHSKYARRSVKLFDKREIVPCLLSQRSGNGKGIVVSCADFATSELDKALELLSPHFHLPTGSSPGVLNHYMNKDVMARLASRKGMNVPEYVIYDGTGDIGGTPVPIPCIVKPLASIHGTKADIKTFREQGDLARFLMGGGATGAPTSSRGSLKRISSTSL